MNKILPGMPLISRGHSDSWIEIRVHDAKGGQQMEALNEFLTVVYKKRHEGQLDRLRALAEAIQQDVGRITTKDRAWHIPLAFFAGLALGLMGLALIGS